MYLQKKFFFWNIIPNFTTEKFINQINCTNMKKILTLSAAMFMAFSCFAQTVITYKNNGLRAGDYRSLKQIEYKDYSQSGANQVWDFSDSKEISSNMYIDQRNNGTSNAGNLLLSCDEGGSKSTFFEISKTKKMYYGLESNSTKISFEEPIVDLKFPFAYGEIINGAMNGTYKVNQKEYTIDGNYFTSADAWGTLILPDGNVYKNTLRIKVEKIYTQELDGIKYDITSVRYQYFAEGVRYPVLIVLESDIKTNCNCNCNHKTQEAFYESPMYFNGDVKEAIGENGENSIISNFEYSVTPNPFSDELTTSFSLSSDAKVTIEINDLSGKTVKKIANEKLKSGDYSFKTNTSDMTQGKYTLIIRVGKKVYTAKVIKK